MPKLESRAVREALSLTPMTFTRWCEYLRAPGEAGPGRGYRPEFTPAEVVRLALIKALTGAGVRVSLAGQLAREAAPHIRKLIKSMDQTPAELRMVWCMPFTWLEGNSEPTTVYRRGPSGQYPVRCTPGDALSRGAAVSFNVNALKAVAPVIRCLMAAGGR